MRWLSEARERVLALLFRRRVDADTEEEMRFHIEMEADRLGREEGLAPEAARRRAAVAFGGVDRHREAVADARGFGSLSGMSLDVKLGARMLAKYPGLTLAGGLALAIAVGLAAAWFEFLGHMTSPQLPLPGADRIVAVRNWDQATAEPERRMLHDLVSWRADVRTIEQLSAASSAEYTVTTEDGRLETVRLARITASAFRMLGVAPVLGRTFIEADEEESGDLPVVLGHGAWQDLFDCDPAVLGRTLRVGDTHATVVGVMPERFGFPVNQQMWVPLRDRAEDWPLGAGPPLLVFGRLAPGVTLTQAQAELTTLGERAAAAHPDTHERLRPEVVRYVTAVSMTPLVTLINVPFLLFLVVVCANVATLVFARTATRSSELAVRSALGASRRRLVLQLVAEALVLTAVAGAAGLVLAHVAIRRGMALFWDVQQMQPPFWFADGISTRTVVYAFFLMLLAALIIGGIPALKATGRQLRHRLAQAGGGGAELRFGRISTAVIVLQVSLCVAFLPVAVLQGRALLPDRDTETRFPAHEFLAARIELQPGGVVRGGDPSAIQRDGDADAAELFGAVKRRLADEQGVTAVAFTSRLPGFNHPVEPVAFESDTGTVSHARVVGVDVDYFDVVGARITRGRGFFMADFGPDGNYVVVAADWARTRFPDTDPIGQRVRFPERGERRDVWHEIVGIVEGMDRATGPGTNVGVFEPLRLGQRHALQLYLRSSVPPASLVTNVYSVTTSLDRRIIVHELKPLEEIWKPVQRSDLFLAGALNVVALVILMFALIGIYALTSFTVAQRTREIAIRTALGADPRRLVVSVFSRVVMQIGLGVLLGAAVVSIAVARTPSDAALIAGIAAAMVAVGLGGCVLPASRALRIQPTAALKEE